MMKVGNGKEDESNISRVKLIIKERMLFMAVEIGKDESNISNRKLTVKGRMLSMMVAKSAKKDETNMVMMIGGGCKTPPKF